MNNKKIYIIIINYNNFKDTIECLESILNISYPNFEIILVDNNSSNNSMAHIQYWISTNIKSGSKTNKTINSNNASHLNGYSLFDFYESKFEKLLESGISNSRLVIIKSDKNGGFSYGNNIAIKYALDKNDFEYIWLLNNDTVIDENALTYMVQLAAKYKDTGIIGSKLIQYHNPELLQTLCGSEEMTWKNGGAGKYLMQNKKEILATESPFEVKGYIVGASMLIPKQVIEKVGLLDEKYFLWSEEVDFACRVRKAGFKNYCCPKAKVYHKEGGSTPTDIYKTFLWKKSRRESYDRMKITVYLAARNKLYFIKKNFGTAHMYKFLFFYLLPKLLREAIRVLIYDDKKFDRINLMINGICDGIACRMGKTEKYFGK